MRMLIRHPPATRSIRSKAAGYGICCFASTSRSARNDARSPWPSGSRSPSRHRPQRPNCIVERAVRIGLTAPWSRQPARCARRRSAPSDRPEDQINYTALEQLRWTRAIPRPVNSCNAGVTRRPRRCRSHFGLLAGPCPARTDLSDDGRGPLGAGLRCSEI